MAKFEVGKSYAYKECPTTKSFKIQKKIGDYLLATVGPSGTTYHLFTLDGFHLGSEGSASRPGWNLVAQERRVQYKVVRTDGTVSDLTDFKYGKTNFSSYTVGGFIKIDDGELKFVNGATDLLNRLIRAHNHGY